MRVGALRWGLLSTTPVGRAVVAATRGSPHARFVAVASSDPGRSAAFAGYTGLAASYGSYERLLAATDIDAVYVAVPPGLHPQWTVRALEAGKHVLCGAPFATSAADAARCFDAAAAAGRLCAEDFAYRTHPATTAARTLVADGAIGRLTYIRAALRTTSTSGSGGGALVDTGCFCVNGIRLFGGEPSTVDAARCAAPDGSDVRFAALLRLTDDVLATFDCGIDQPPADELELVGTAGRLRIPDPWRCGAAHLELERTDDGVRRVPVQLVDPYRTTVDAFSAACRGDAPWEWGRTDAVAQAATLERLRAAAG